MVTIGRRHMTGMLAAAGGLVLCRRVGAAALPQPPLAVVVGSGTALTDLAVAALRALFQADTTMVDGVRLAPFNRPPQSLDRVAFDRLVLGLSPDDVSRFWIDRRIRGQGRPPRVCEDPSLLARLVIRLPGAIAYVRADKVLPGMKALTIGGKMPSDAGYQLKEKT